MPSTPAAIRLAMGQMLVEGGQAERNLQRAEGMVAKAARAGCQLIVLPECLDLGWTHPSARRQAEPIPGPFADRLCRAACEHGIHVAAGLTERSGRRIYNAALLIDPQGRILLQHRKINVLDIAQDLYSIGDRLGVAETQWGTIGLTICADNFPDSLALGHALARMGCQLLVSPSAWAVAAEHDNRREPYGDLWRDAYRELARLYGLPVVGVSNVGWLTAGPWQGRKCIGCSLAMGADGRVICEGPYGDAAEALIECEIELRQPGAMGTRLAEDLRRRGYAGP